MTINSTGTNRHSLFIHAGGPSLQEIPKNAPRTFLREPYASMPPDVLLDYFQQRNNPQYFPLSHGSPDHIERADRILKNEFHFNNETHQLADSFDWTVNPSRDIEWLILLHKFYYARDLATAYDYSREEHYARKWVQLVSSWINEVPEGFIDSQVTGRRLQQWILAYHYFVPRQRSTSITPLFLTAFIGSIHAQTRYLSEHLTPEGNHRTIELYAIFLVAVIFPELRESARLLDLAKLELLKNMERDLLDDGVQRELSTDYHHTVLKNYLRAKELAVLNEVAFSPRYDELMIKALEFSIYVHKPDGLIPALNDGDCNSYLSLLKKAYSYYPTPHLLYVISKGTKGTPPPERCKAFSTSGYYVLRGSWASEPYEDGLYLMFDCGPLGFGSHGHYDLLNIEAAAFGHSLIVDPGRYTYAENNKDGINWRRIFKSTAYHNTVVVDGKDQSPYRQGQPASPEPEARLLTFATADWFDFIHAQAVSHEYPVAHERTIFFAVPEYWIVTDTLRGEGSHDYDLYFHLSPMAHEQTMLQTEAINPCVTSPNLIIAQPASPNIHASILEGVVSPQYGEKQPAPIVKFSQSTHGVAFFHTVLYPYRRMQPAVQVEPFKMTNRGTPYPPTTITALKMTIRSEADQHSDYFLFSQKQEISEYAFDDILCRSRMLFLRKNREGHIVNLQAEGLDHLQIGSQVLLEGIGGNGRMSYRGRQFHFEAPGRTRRGTIEQINEISQLLTVR